MTMLGRGWRAPHYLHADECETEPGAVYCTRCDVFCSASHFGDGAPGLMLADGVELRARHREAVRKLRAAGRCNHRAPTTRTAFDALRRVGTAPAP